LSNNGHIIKKVMNCESVESTVKQIGNSVWCCCWAALHSFCTQNFTNFHFSSQKNYLQACAWYIVRAMRFYMSS
jgi:hypothetical protein